MSLRSLDAFEAPNAPVEDNQEAGVDVRRYIAACLHFKWAILVFVAVVALAAWMYAKTLTPIYEARSTLLLEADRANFVSIEQLYEDRRGATVRTELEIMRSRAVAELVVERLGLDRDLAFVGPYQRAVTDPARWFASMAAPDQARLDPERAREIAISRVRSGTRVSIVSGTTLVRVSFQSPFRDRAQEIVNAIGDAYIDQGLDSRAESTTRAATWLAERLDVLRANLRASEARLQEYREVQGLAEASAVTGDDSVVRVAALELETLRDEVSENEASVTRLASALALLDDSPREQWATISSLSGDESLGPLLEARVDAQRRISELGQVYGRRHPKMIQAQAEFRDIERSIDGRVASVRARMEAELSRASEAQSELASSVESQRTRIQGMQRQQFELTKLQRDVETDQRLYDLFLERIKETEQASFEEPVARIIEAARTASRVGPNENRIILLAVFGALALCVGLVVLREVLDNTFKTPDELSEMLGLASLGILPQAQSEEKRGEVGLLFASEEQGQFAEAVRTLRTSVVLSGLDRPHQLICVTSAMPGEGKTTVSTNLALSLSRLEKVLLIDADMRRPSIAREFDLPASSGGVSAIMAGDMKPEQCIVSHPSGLDVLAAGIVPPNPLELLSSKRFRLLIDALRKRYDRIVVDTAPVHAVSDALVMASIADAMVFVAKAESTPRAVVQNSVRRLRQVNAPVIGAVLNRVRFDGKGRYAAGYYGYYGYYGYADYSSTEVPAEGAPASGAGRDRALGAA